MPQHASRAVYCAFEFAKSCTEKLEHKLTCWDQFLTRASRWPKLGKFGSSTRDLRSTVGKTSSSQQKK